MLPSDAHYSTISQREHAQGRGGKAIIHPADESSRGADVIARWAAPRGARLVWSRVMATHVSSSFALALAATAFFHVSGCSGCSSCSKSNSAEAEADAVAPTASATPDAARKPTGPREPQPYAAVLDCARLLPKTLAEKHF